MAMLVERAGLSNEFELDSAGTGNWHVGDTPDPRALEAAARRGIELHGRARQVDIDDFERFDLIVAMDRSNLADLEALAPGTGDGAELHRLREFDPAEGEQGPGGDDRDEGRRGGSLDVPDPYHGGAEGFDLVLALIERCCRGLLQELTSADGTSTHPVPG